MPKKKVVLAYSGGLDTSVCIPLLREKYECDEVVTITVDVGQPHEDIQEAAEKAKKLGTEHYTIEAKQEFVEDYIFRAIKANGNYEGYPLSTSIARPLIAQKTVEVAQRIKAQAIAHGCTGKGNDQFRFEFVFRVVAPELQIIAPMREFNLTRSEEIEYAKAHGVPVPVTVEKIWSIDENLWGRSIEGGKLEQPDFTPPEEIYAWTKGAPDAPAQALEISIGFENGVPVSIDGKSMKGLELIQTLNQLAGEHGVGRIDMMEDRILGLKARENYECPAATCILTAHKALEALVLTKEELKFKAIIDAQWAELAYYGLWFDPLKEDLEAFIDKTQERVTGTVKLRLHKGNAKVIGRESKWAIYSEDLISFDTKTFDQREAEGIVKHHGLQAQMYWKLKRKK